MSPCDIAKLGRSAGRRVYKPYYIHINFSQAVEWGLMARHPFKGEVRLKGDKPRTRYIEDWEIIETLSLVPKRKSGSVLMLQAYIRVKMLIGIRRGDMLRLRMSDIRSSPTRYRAVALLHEARRSLLR
jgi:integrase